MPTQVCGEQAIEPEPLRTTSRNPSAVTIAQRKPCRVVVLSAALPNDSRSMLLVDEPFAGKPAGQTGRASGERQAMERLPRRPG